MKVGKSAETYQVGAHFKALIKAILVAPSRTLEKFFSFRVSLPRCVGVLISSSNEPGQRPGVLLVIINEFQQKVKPLPKVKEKKEEKAAK